MAMKEITGIVEKTYDEAVDLVSDFFKLQNLGERDREDFSRRFYSNLAENGVYDAGQMRERLSSFTHYYFVEDGDPNNFDYSFEKIKEVKLPPKVLKKKTPIEFFGEGIYHFIKKELNDERCTRTLEGIVDSPITRELFDRKNLREKIDKIKFLAENYHIIDQKIIYEVTGLNKDGSTGRIKWTEETTDKILSILNDYYSGDVQRKNFHNISPITSRIYSRLQKSDKERLQKALRGQLNQ